MSRSLLTCVMCTALAGLSVLAGCSKESDNWLIGEWAYDAQATKSNLPTNIKAEGVPDIMAEQLGAQLVEQLMSQMEGVELHFTADEVSFISAKGTETHDYKIASRPDANTIKIESEEPATFIRSGKYLCIPSAGDVDFKMYFKPVE
ncbi:hypothetical protein STSP2_00012 [Anaerohalosphaera lusitana]|uniref:Lipocalin-like domain-containing protein n=1 Tax=Anaerohalosphaera lusitana TaxID=1936003 RepID=A0A1U9NGK9_9BACT|nr:hypothetical protein [Anaerohalosphaera lusitana]AQT66874.1 hypothetical protein STSP2_00012 [Anaerohalosphaera lusitana]